MRGKPPREADLPPELAGIEAAVLALLMREAESARTALNLPPECFRLPRHRLVFEAARELAAAGKPFDAVCVAEHLTAADQLDAAGGAAGIAQLSEEPASVASLGYYCEKLVEAHKHRLALAALTEAQEAAREHPKLAPDILRHAANAIESLTPRAKPQSRPWLDIETPPGDSDVLIGPGRWVCRGAGVQVVGPSGAGKSTWTATQVFAWALGRPSLGMVPTRPLKSIVFQAEDDDGDLQAMRDGALVPLNPTEQELELLRANVLVVTDRASTGIDFLARVVEPALVNHPADLIFINPLSAFFGNDLNDQQATAAFFRNTLNPILARHGCAGFIVHHIPKPTKERKDWIGNDLSYAGAGSADLSNWSRETIVLRQTSTPGLYEMAATKRWRKLGWNDADGRPTATRLIAYGPNGQQFWRDATPDLMADLGARTYSDAALLELVPEAGLDKTELTARVMETFAVSDRTARDYIRDATRAKLRTLNCQRVKAAILRETSRPRREVYPECSKGRDVVWITKL